jgi:type IV fimbrial biogenesis protein FimT
MPGLSSGHGNGGFTLVELMITVVIVAILLAIAGPSFVELLERNRMQTSASNVYTSLMLARSEALKRNQSVQVCSSTSGTACDPNEAGLWKDGWLVWVDRDGDTNVDDPNEVLAVRGALYSGDTLWAVTDPNDMSGGTKIDDITYQASGGASEEAFFVLCPSDGDTSMARVVSVEITGRPKITEAARYCTF